jgi:hypothetical protein
MKKTKKIGEFLCDAGIIDEMQLSSALGHQKEWGGRLGSVCVKKGFISGEQLSRSLEQQFGTPCLSLKSAAPSRTALDSVTVETAKKLCIFPLRFEGKTLVVAAADPTDLSAFDELGFMLGIRIKPLLSSEAEILRAIGIHYEGILDSRPFPERNKFGRISEEAISAKPAILPEKIVHLNVREIDEPAPKKPDSGISQKVIIESMIEILISKGVFSRDELMNQIRSCGKGFVQ